VKSLRPRAEERTSGSKKRGRAGTVAPPSRCAKRSNHAPLRLDLRRGGCGRRGGPKRPPSTHDLPAARQRRDGLGRLLARRPDRRLTAVAVERADAAAAPCGRGRAGLHPSAPCRGTCTGHYVAVLRNPPHPDTPIAYIPTPPPHPHHTPPPNPQPPTPPPPPTHPPPPPTPPTPPPRPTNPPEKKKKKKNRGNCSFRGRWAGGSNVSSCPKPRSGEHPGAEVCWTSLW